MVALFPIETQSRELDYKLILAHYCSTNYGVRSYLGSVPSIHSNINQFKNGLYFSKTIFSRPKQSGNIAFYKKVKSLGFDIAYLHEEGGVWNGGEKDWVQTLNKMYDLSIFDHNDLVLLWGEWQKQAEENRNAKKIPLHVTGSPRFDLLKEYQFFYQKEVNELKNKYGDYVLISGKYTIANHGENYHKATEDVTRWHGDYSHNLRKFYKLTQLTANKMFSMVELVAYCALKLPKTTFIFRPHPSERLETYHDLFSRIDNVKIIREGSANKYILGSKALIHDGCTTALEAVNAGIPILNYSKVKSDLDVFLPSQIGFRADSLEDAYLFIENCLEGVNDSLYQVEDELAKSLLMNLSGESSFQKIFRMMDEYFLDKADSSEFPTNTQLNKWYYKSFAKISLSNYKNTLIGRRDKVSKTRYLMNKFPGMSKEHIQMKVSLLNEHFQNSVRLNFLNSQICYLERK